MQKKAVSAVIAAVLIILITIAAVSILWVFITPMVQKISMMNEPVNMEIIQEGYTVWDPINRLVEIQVKRGSDKAELIGFNLIFTFDGDSIKHKIRKEIELNSKSVYNINFSSTSGELETVRLIPVYKGEIEGDVISILSISKVPPKDLSSSGKTYSLIGTLPIDPVDPCSGSCESNWCGDHDICGLMVNCGGCDDDKTCNTEGLCEGPTGPCSPDCDGKECGSDGCTGTCGPDTQSCNQVFGSCTVAGTKTCSGSTYLTCAATDPRIENCAGKQCGTDGCGGSCGTCPGGFQCTSSQICEPSIIPCSDPCGTRECGINDCGESCGPDSTSCLKSFGTCTVTGTKTCIGTTYSSCSATDPTIANCAGKQCGSDGCGGSCGTCASGKSCSSGQCVSTYFKADVYVDKNVQDCITYNPSIRSCSNGNERVYNTIQEAANVLTAGQKVAIRGGTYSEQVKPSNSGSPAEGYITYMSYPGEKAILDGSTVSVPLYTGLIDIKSKSYINISGLKIRNVTNNIDKYNKNAGIWIQTSGAGTPHNIVIEKNLFDNSCGPAIQIQNNIYNVIIDGNEFIKNCNECRGEIVSLKGVHDFEIKNNLVHDGGKGWWDEVHKFWDGGEGIGIAEASYNGKVFNNAIYNLFEDAGIYLDAQSHDLHDIEVYNNQIYSSREGIAWGGEEGGKVRNLKIHHNIAYNNANYGFNVGGYVTQGVTGGERRNIEVINNVAYNNGKGGIYIYNRVYYNISIKNNIASKNNLYQIQFLDDHPEEFNISFNLIDWFKGYTGETRGNDSVSGDPKFVLPTSDFHLQSNSPAINKGTKVGLTRDFDGKLITGIPEIGAYEY